MISRNIDLIAIIFLLALVGFISQAHGVLNPIFMRSALAQPRNPCVVVQAVSAFRNLRLPE